MTVEQFITFRCVDCSAIEETTPGWEPDNCWACGGELIKMLRRSGWRCNRCMTVWLGKTEPVDKHYCSGQAEWARTREERNRKRGEQLVAEEKARRAATQVPLEDIDHEQLKRDIDDLFGPEEET